jgi:hypothetical protein
MKPLLTKPHQSNPETLAWCEVLAHLRTMFHPRTRGLYGGTTPIVVLISNAAVDRPKLRRCLTLITSSTPTHIHIGPFGSRN